MTERPPFTIKLTAGTPSKVNGPCPTCHRWTLWRTPVLVISKRGASVAGHGELCEICDTEEDE